MDVKNMIGMVVAIVIGVIMIGPLTAVIANADQDLNNIKYNDQTANSIRMAFGTPSDDLTVEKPAGEALINMYLGESETPYYTFPLNTDGYVAWALVTSTFSYGITGGASNSLIDYTARNTAETGGLTNHYGLSTAFTVNLNVTTGAISVVLDGTTYSMYAPCDVERIYWADPNGDYINVDTRGNYSPIYLEDPKDIIGSLMIGGNYVFWQDTDNVEVTNNMSATITTTTTTQDNGLYVLDEISFELTGTDNNVRTGDMGHCLVKYEVHGNPDQFGITDLLNLIPIIVTAGLIIGIVGAIFVRRLE